MVAFIGHTRNLVTHRTSSESTDEKTLEDIRDLLLKIEDAQSPHDIDISSHMLT
jgi:hypothetical protein